jgi:hypothetical protein
MALRNAISIEQLCDEYVSDMENGNAAGKKASTVKSDISRIATHIKPVLGKRKSHNLTPWWNKLRMPDDVTPQFCATRLLRWQPTWDLQII